MNEESLKNDNEPFATLNKMFINGMKKAAHYKGVPMWDFFALLRLAKEIGEEESFNSIFDGFGTDAAGVINELASYMVAVAKDIPERADFAAMHHITDLYWSVFEEWLDDVASRNGYYLNWEEL